MLSRVSDCKIEDNEKLESIFYFYKMVLDISLLINLILNIVIYGLFIEWEYDEEL